MNTSHNGPLLFTAVPTCALYNPPNTAINLSGRLSLLTFHCEPAMCAKVRPRPEAARPLHGFLRDTLGELRAETQSSHFRWSCSPYSLRLTDDVTRILCYTPLVAIRSSRLRWNYQIRRCVPPCTSSSIKCTGEWAHNCRRTGQLTLRL
ncbi:hypothetical protein AVEN_200067-1 [Araneus ventricosus]|uniref:Uncharacterized protein n=1 Tax=Araneus ventricosus TaxID=182803 RepID=A0A4Y2PF55_ARAVE|nr:hypothetical protein AVEN_200067-1 [Araneus ventricosus]